MEDISVVVKSPSRSTHAREGKGFSLGEIKEAGKTIQLLKELGIYIDFNRKSIHSENVEQLKNLEPPKKKGKKREPFKPKEKKVRVRQKRERKEKEEEKPVKKKKAKEPKTDERTPEPEGGELKLTELNGLGPATATKFEEVGVKTVADLIKEDAQELGLLIKGCSEDRISGWIEEGKKLLKK